MLHIRFLKSRNIIHYKSTLARLQHETRVQFGCEIIKFKESSLTVF